MCYATSNGEKWYSARTLAALALDGFPHTKRGVNKMARAKGWPHRKRYGRGGGREYPVSVLPEDIQQQLLQRAQDPWSTGQDKGPDSLDVVPGGGTYPLESGIGQPPVGVSPGDGVTYCTEGPVRGDLGLEGISSPAPSTAVPFESRKLNLVEQTRHNREQVQREDGLRQAVSLTGKDQQVVDAKLAILQTWEAFRQERYLSSTRSGPIFAEAYNTGQVDIHSEVRGLIPAISASSLQRWGRALRKEGITALANPHRGRAGTGQIDTQPAIKEFVLGMITSTPHCRAHHILDALQARFGQDDSVKLPALRSLQRWIQCWRKQNEQTITAVSHPDKWKSKYMVAFGGAGDDVIRLNQRWEMDSTPADVLLTDGRHTLIGCIDVYSRRAKILVSKTSKATAVSLLIRRSILDWGVPETIKTDNGQDYVSHHIRRCLAGLAIQQELCPPFQPWKKPFIERFFRTFSHDVVELLAGYIGHNVADREAIRARQSFADRLMKRGEVFEIKMSAAELQEFCDRWCETIYHHRPHSGLGNETPFARAASWREPVRRIQDERALDILLAEVPGNGLRTVQKKGIQIDWAWFIAPELEAYVGQTVHVRFDPQDLGYIYVFDDDGFVCLAQCPERTGISRQEIAAKARELQKKRVQEERQALKQLAKAIKTDEVVDEIFRAKAQASGKLALFPSPSIAHDSPGLQAAAEAVASINRPVRFATLTEEERRLADAIDWQEPPDWEEPWERYERLRKQPQVTEVEAAWMRHFEQTPQGQSLLEWYEWVRQDRLAQG